MYVHICSNLVIVHFINPPPHISGGTPPERPDAPVLVPDPQDEGDRGGGMGRSSGHTPTAPVATPTCIHPPKLYQPVLHKWNIHPVQLYKKKHTQLHVHTNIHNVLTHTSATLCNYCLKRIRTCINIRTYVYLQVYMQFRTVHVLYVLLKPCLHYTFKPVPKPLEVEPTCIRWIEPSQLQSRSVVFTHQFQAAWEPAWRCSVNRAL